MPELPEVETVCRGLEPVLRGRRLSRVEARRADLRRPIPPDLSQRLTGQRVMNLERRAKYILIHFETAETLLVHLGMSGRFTFAPGVPGVFEPHDHVILVTDAGMCLRLNDPRRFGLVDLVRTAALATHPLLASLGPEPLGPDFTGAVLAGRLAGRGTAIKTVLLDQRVVAGIGNIYACEALFVAGIDPLRPADSLTGAECGRLVAAIRDVLARAIAAGGSSLRDHVQADGTLGYFQHAWAVYGRAGAPCPGCDCAGSIMRIVQGGRATFYCPQRQR